MYVTGGQYKGKRITTPSGVKPTLSKTRESVFNILTSLLGSFEGKSFLDMFGGSGLMSLEAVSRGFYSITIEKDRKSYFIIKNNLEIAGKKAKIICANSLDYIEKSAIKPNVIYIDPPWDSDYKIILNKVFSKFKNSIIVVEYDKKRADEFFEFYKKTVLPFKEKVYGRCKLDFIKLDD